MSWLLVFAVLASGFLIAAAARFVFQESRRAQVLDRRLAGVRAWAVTVYDEPGQRKKREGSEFSPQRLVVGILNVSSLLVPVGATERAKLRPAPDQGRLSPSPTPCRFS